MKFQSTISNCLNKYFIFLIWCKILCFFQEIESFLCQIYVNFWPTLNPFRCYIKECVVSMGCETAWLLPFFSPILCVQSIVLSGILTPLSSINSLTFIKTLSDVFFSSVEIQVIQRHNLLPDCSGLSIWFSLSEHLSWSWVFCAFKLSTCVIFFQ